jgi:hypothetical protein
MLLIHGEYKLGLLLYWSSSKLMLPAIGLYVLVNILEGVGSSLF